MFEDTINMNEYIARLRASYFVYKIPVQFHVSRSPVAPL